MADPNIKTTYFGVLSRALLANTHIIKWALILYPAIYINSYIDIQAGKKILNFLSSIYTDAHSKNYDFNKAAHTFGTCVAMLFSHYALASCIDYYRAKFSLFVYKTFLQESVRQVLGMDYTEFHGLGSGNIQERLIRSSKAARDSYPILFFDIPISVFLCLNAIIEVFGMMKLKYFSIFLTLSFLAFFVAFFIGKFAYIKELRNVSYFVKTLIPFSDILSNFDVIEAFNKENYELENYKKDLLPYVKSTAAYYFQKHVLMLIQKFMLFFPQAAIIFCVMKGSDIWRVHENKVIENPLVNYNNIFIKFKKRCIEIKKDVFDLLKMAGEIQMDLSFMPPPKIGLFYKPDFKDSIRMLKTHFYAGNNLILKSQSFELAKGLKFGITGTNGAGKTVFIKTLLRFFKHEGSIYIDENLISSLSDLNIRDLIAYAPQDPHIFNNTVMYNLCYALSERPDPEDIYKICQAYGMHEFFSSMKDGYETQAGEHGKYLSGGQKQRISIMRAVIKNAPIIIMDEPTANIDKNSENQIFDKIFELNPTKTIIVIVHNYELLKKFDKILYFTKQGVQVFDGYDAFIDRDASVKALEQNSPIFV